MALKLEEIIKFLIQNKAFFIITRDNPKELASYLSSKEGKQYEQTITEFSQAFVQAVKEETKLIHKLNNILAQKANSLEGQLKTYLKKYPDIQKFLSDNLETLTNPITNWKIWDTEKIARAKQISEELSEKFEETEKRYRQILKELREIVTAEDGTALDFLDGPLTSELHDNDASVRLKHIKKTIRDFFQTCANATDMEFEEAANRFMLAKVYQPGSLPPKSIGIQGEATHTISTKYNPILFLLDIHREIISANATKTKENKIIHLNELCKAYKTHLKKEIKREFQSLPKKTQEYYQVISEETRQKKIKLDSLLGKVNIGLTLHPIELWDRDFPHTNESHPALTQALRKYGNVKELTGILNNNELNNDQKLAKFNQAFFKAEGIKENIESTRDTLGRKFITRVIQILSFGMITQEKAKKVTSLFWKSKGKKMASKIAKPSISGQKLRKGR